MSSLLKKNGVTGENLNLTPDGEATGRQQTADLQENGDLLATKISATPPRKPRSQAEPGTELPLAAGEAAEARDTCLALARRARDAFKDACLAQTPDEAEAAFSSARHLLQTLWGYAYLRDRPFRDLLALLDAALTRTDLTEFNETQRAALRQAFSNLGRWMLGPATVDEHILQFADYDIDITGPLRADQGKRFRVKIEVVED